MTLQEVNQLTIDAYEQLASKYHESFKDEMTHKEYDKKILDQFSEMLHPSSKICDAGCGPSGHIGKYLQKKGLELAGIDISPKCIELATQYEKDIKFHCMDMMDMQFESSSFDGIISFYSIIHTPKIDVPKIFQEYNRVLKPDGLILIVVKKGTAEGIISGEWYEGNQIYFTNFLENEISDYLTESGFKIISLETRNPYNSEITVDRIYTIAKKYR